MNFLFKVLGIQEITETFNKNIERMGWHKANKQYIKDLGILQKSSFINFPKKGGVLVYANHITGLDPYLLSSAIDRDDVYFLSDIYQTRKGAAVAAHIIPVYYSTWQDSFRRFGMSFFGFLMMRLLVGTVPKSIARKRNAEAIARAVSYLKKENVVIIFPSGGEKKANRWKKGIGEIVVNCREKNVSLVLYKCFFTQLQESDLVKHFVTGRKYLKRFPVKLSGKRISLNSSVSLIDSVKITSYLQNDF
jgi:hypothetical protein